MLRTFAVLSTAVLFSQGALAQGTSPGIASVEEKAAINQVLIEDFVIGRYRSFAGEAALLSEATRGYCAQPEEGLQSQLAKSYARAYAAWAGVQFLRFGPIENDGRAYAIAFWPDKRNKVGRDVARALASTEALPPLAEGSVTLQGFPAYERLLVMVKEGGAATPQFQKVCGLMTAIAVNLVQITEALAQDWQAPPVNYAQSLLHPTAETAYRTTDEVSETFLKSLNGGLQLIADLKLAMPLGRDLKKARGKRAEAWRMGLSLDLVRANLMGLDALYRGGDAAGFAATLRKYDPEGADRLDAEFAQSLKLLDEIALPLDKAVADEVAREKVVALRSALNELRESVVKKLFPVIGVSVGFNAFDGD